MTVRAFPAGDSWSIVCLFAVLAVAVWLRPLNYAFWAAGMTAAQIAAAENWAQKWKAK